MPTFQLIKDTKAAVKNSPRQIFNWYLFTCTILWSLPGVSKGFDEGNIASIVVLDVFQTRFGVDQQSTKQYADTKGWIVSIATAGAVFGCLSCLYALQKFGRKPILAAYTVIYIAGILGQTFCGGNLSGLYASRFIAGFGIGTMTILPSVHVSEISPQSIRGLLTLQSGACQQLGVVFGFFINYGVTKHLAGRNLQWQLPTALQLVPATIWGIGAMFTPESPRYLLSVNKRSEALAVLSRLRNLPSDHDYVRAEFAGMELQLEREIEVVAGTSTLDCIKETFLDVSNRRRFVLMFLAHTFGQWSGANAITQYSPTIFGYLGIEGDEARFLATGLYSIVKFTSTVLCALVVIDFIGRRRSLMTGICMQIITLVYVGAYLGATNGRSTTSIANDASATAASKVAIVSIYFHAVAWSIGWFSIPYLVSAEIFPTRIRSFNMSILMAFHWAFYFGCSRAMPSLLVATHRYGAFVFFASICVCSLVFVYLCMPETAGRSLESMQHLFERPLWTIHRIAYPKAEDMEVQAVLSGIDGFKGLDRIDKELATAQVERV